MTDNVTEQQIDAEQAIAESPDAQRAAEKRRAALGAEPEKREAAPKGRRSSSKSTADDD